MFEIWVTEQESGCQVLDYVNGLAKATKDRLFAVIKKTADEGKYTSEEIYRHIGDGIYEFKAQTSRLYSFNDGRRIILTRVREGYETWKGAQSK
jgi:hypothetical protein